MKLAMKFGKKIKFNLAIKKLRDYGREIEMGFNRCTLFGRLPKKTILIKRERDAGLVEWKSKRNDPSSLLIQKAAYINVRACRLNMFEPI